MFARTKYSFSLLFRLYCSPSFFLVCILFHSHLCPCVHSPSDANSLTNNCYHKHTCIQGALTLIHGHICDCLTQGCSTSSFTVLGDTILEDNCIPKSLTFEPFTALKTVGFNLLTEGKVRNKQIDVVYVRKQRDSCVL